MSRVAITGRVSSASRVFSPTLVPETKFWFNAGTGVTNVSGAASAWQDVTETYTASQATGAKRPTIAAGINGRASLLFDSAASQDLANTTDDPVGAGFYRYVLIVAQATSPGGTLFTFRSGNTGGTQAVWALQVIDGGGFAYYYTDTVAQNINDGSLPAYTSPFLIEYEIKTAALAVRVNNASRTAAGGTVSIDAGDTGFRIGSSLAASGFFKGHIGDIYCASDLPSLDNRDRLRTYFATYYGISI